jgi:hypothetical protein
MMTTPVRSAANIVDGTHSGLDFADCGVGAV